LLNAIRICIPRWFTGSACRPVDVEWFVKGLMLWSESFGLPINSALGFYCLYFDFLVADPTLEIVIGYRWGARRAFSKLSSHMSGARFPD
jgi:hypothetical protein